MRANERRHTSNEDIEFELGSGDLLARMRKSGGKVVLTRKGRAAAVALDMKSYREVMARVHELETLQGIQRGLDDIAQGRYMTLGQFRAHMERRFAVSRTGRGKRRR